MQGKEVIERKDIGICMGNIKVDISDSDRLHIIKRLSYFQENLNQISEDMSLEWIKCWNCGQEQLGTNRCRMCNEWMCYECGGKMLIDKSSNYDWYRVCEKCSYTIGYGTIMFKD